jgi:hypothetical protein
MQLDINNLHFKTDCALDKIKYKFILNIICYDSLSHAQNVVMKSFREGDFFFTDYDELQNFKISNGNLLNIKKIVKEKNEMIIIVPKGSNKNKKKIKKKSIKNSEIIVSNGLIKLLGICCALL